MATFVMMTRLAHGALKSPKDLQDLEFRVKQRIHNDAPAVSWAGSYALLGPYDYLDVFHAPDIETAMRVATIIRTFGHAHTEVWAATEWSRFKEMLHHLPVV